MKNIEEWRRKLCSLMVKGIKGIVEVMLVKVKSWIIVQQFDWMKEAYPQKFEDGKKYVVAIWRRDEMIEVIQEEIEGL